MNRRHRTYWMLYGDGRRALSASSEAAGCASAAPDRGEGRRPCPSSGYATSPPRTRQLREEQHRGRLGLALLFVVAALLHGVILLPVFSAWIFMPQPVAALQETQIVALPSARQTRRQASATQSARPRPEAKTRPKRKDILPEGQLVTLPRSRDEPPERADHYAQDDHRADRETRSRRSSAQWENPAHRPSTQGETTPLNAGPPPLETRTRGAASRNTAPPGQPMADESPVATSPPTSSPQNEQTKRPERSRPDRVVAGAGDVGGSAQSDAAPPVLSLPSAAARPRLALAQRRDGQLRNRERRPAHTQAKEGLQLRLDGLFPRLPPLGGGASAPPGSGRRGAAGTAERPDLPDLATLTPSWQALQRFAGMPANDYLPEVETDAETRLNAWRWRHATFFDRMKQAISRNWRGLEAYQRHDPTRQVYGSQRLMTILQITIDRQGTIRSLHIREASGASFFDEEAVRATRVAGPFPNPPAALFGEAMTFSFQFGFVLTNEWRHIDLNWRPY